MHSAGNVVLSSDIAAAAVSGNPDPTFVPHVGRQEQQFDGTRYFDLTVHDHAEQFDLTLDDSEPEQELPFELARSAKPSTILLLRKCCQVLKPLKVPPIVRIWKETKGVTPKGRVWISTKANGKEDRATSSVEGARNCVQSSTECSRTTSSVETGGTKAKRKLRFEGTCNGLDGCSSQRMSVESAEHAGSTGQMEHVEGRITSDSTRSDRQSTTDDPQLGKYKTLKMTQEQILKEEGEYVDWVMKEFMKGTRFECAAMLRLNALALICGKGVLSKELGDALAEEMEDSKEEERKTMKKEFFKMKAEVKKESTHSTTDQSTPVKSQNVPIYTSEEDDEEDPKKKSRAAKDSSSEATSWMELGEKRKFQPRRSKK